MRFCLLPESGYRVGTDGSVWSCRRPGRPSGTPTLRRGEWRKLVASPDSNGYLTVKIAGRTRKVHELILTAFRGSRPPGLECRHLNGNPADNRLRNLRWGTPTQNTTDRHRHGRRHGMAKLMEPTIRRIWRLHQTGWNCAEISRFLGIPRGTVWDAVRGRTWKHLQRRTK